MVDVVRPVGDVSVTKGKVVVATADGQGHLLRITPNANR